MLTAMAVRTCWMWAFPGQQRGGFGYVLDGVFEGGDFAGERAGGGLVDPGLRVGDAGPVPVGVGHGLLGDVRGGLHAGSVVDQEARQRADIFAVEDGELRVCLLPGKVEPAGRAGGAGGAAGRSVLSAGSWLLMLPGPPREPECG
jgi:hypothetical protein